MRGGFKREGIAATMVAFFPVIVAIIALLATAGYEISNYVIRELTH